MSISAYITCILSTTDLGPETCIYSDESSGSEAIYPLFISPVVLGCIFLGIVITLSIVISYVIG